MIRVTRFDHQTVFVNGLLVSMVEGVPDTFITLLNGQRLHVRESVSEVVEMLVAYHRKIYAGVMPEKNEGK